MSELDKAFDAANIVFEGIRNPVEPSLMAIFPDIDPATSPYRDRLWIGDKVFDIVNCTQTVIRSQHDHADLYCQIHGLHDFVQPDGEKEIRMEMLGHALVASAQVFVEHADATGDITYLRLLAPKGVRHEE